MEELLAERIVQLDNLYSIARDLRFKALILSQMIHLAKAVDPDFLKDERIRITVWGDGWEEKEFSDINIAEVILELAYSYEKAYHSDNRFYTIHSLAMSVMLMDRIKTKILTMLIEKGLIKHFKEIPIAIAKKEEVEEYE